MTDGHELDRPATYQIRIRGTLDPKWSPWFEDLAVVPQQDGQTLLTGSVADQAALYGILLKLHNLGLIVLLVERIDA